MEEIIQEGVLNNDHYRMTRTDDGVIKAYKNGELIKPDPLFAFNNMFIGAKAKQEPPQPAKTP